MDCVSDCFANCLGRLGTGVIQEGHELITAVPKEYVSKSQSGGCMSDDVQKRVVSNSPPVGGVYLFQADDVDK